MTSDPAPGFDEESIDISRWSVCILWVITNCLFDGSAGVTGDPTEVIGALADWVMRVSAAGGASAAVDECGSVLLSFEPSSVCVTEY